MSTYLQVSRIDPSLRLISLAQHIRDLDSSSQLAAELHPLRGRGTSPRVVELLEDNTSSRCSVIPGRPSRRLNNVAQHAVLPDHASERPPRAAQGRRGDTGRPKNVGVVEDVNRAAVGRLTAAGGDVSGAHGLDVATLEPRLRVAAKDEVGGAGDQGLGEDLAALVGQDGVLVAGEVAAVEALVRGVDVDGQRLADVAGGVGDVEVVHADVLALEAHRAGQVVAGLARDLGGYVLLREGVGDGDLVVGVRARVARVPLQDERARKGRDEELLFVGTRHEEERLLLGLVDQRGDGLVGGLEGAVVRARGVDDDGAGGGRRSCVGAVAGGGRRVGASRRQAG